MATTVVNIGEVEDEFYRYKMPQLVTKIEGRGNGIKTVLVNALDVARALGRPVTYLTKFFGTELCAQSKYDAKNEKAIVNGAHDNSVMRDHLLAFVRRFVECGTCKNPETRMHVTRHGDVVLECIACGNTTLVDPREKLCKFIANNPPDKEAAVGRKGSKRKAAGAGTAAAAVGGGETAGRPGEVVVAEDEIDTTPISTADVDRLAEEIDQQQLAEAEQNPIERVAGFIAEEHTQDDLSALVRHLVGIHSLKSKDVVLLMFHAVLTGPAAIVEHYEEAAAVLVDYMQDNESVQRSFLTSFQKAAGSEMGPLGAKVSAVLKRFYDIDALDEDVLLEWADKPAKTKAGRAVRAAAKPLIDWLREADEESDEDEED